MERASIGLIQSSCVCHGCSLYGCASKDQILPPLWLVSTSQTGPQEVEYKLEQPEGPDLQQESTGLLHSPGMQRWLTLPHGTYLKLRNRGAENQTPTGWFSVILGLLYPALTVPKSLKVGVSVTCAPLYGQSSAKQPDCK